MADLDQHLYAALLAAGIHEQLDLLEQITRGLG